MNKYLKFCRKAAADGMVLLKNDRSVLPIDISNKVALFKEKYGDCEIENFYTDSKNDLPMIKISKNAFLVKDDKIKKIK